jgi:ketosteroid isomerase-like protein
MRLAIMPMAAAAVLVAAPALAKDFTPEEIIHRHVDAANRGDAAAMAADYAPDAVILEPGHATHGRAAIQTQFNGIFGSAAKFHFKVTPMRIWSEGDVGFITWTANNGQFGGQDTYLVRHGQILVQAVYIAPRPPRPSLK